MVALAKVIRTPGAAGQRLQAALSQLGKKAVRIGVFESARYEDGTPVAGVAAVQELGSPVNNTPPRSFMRSTAEDKKQEWADLGKQGMVAVLSGTESVDSVMEKIGLVAAGQVRAKIGSITQPALAQSTIDAKGFEKPLVGKDKLLINSISHEVE